MHGAAEEIYLTHRFLLQLSRLNRGFYCLGTCLFQHLILLLQISATPTKWFVKRVFWMTLAGEDRMCRKGLRGL